MNTGGRDSFSLCWIFIPFRILFAMASKRNFFEKLSCQKLLASIEHNNLAQISTWVKDWSNCFDPMKNIAARA